MAKDMEAVINGAIDNAIDNGELADTEVNEGGEGTTEVTETETDVTDITEKTTEADVTTDTTETKKEDTTDPLMEEFIKEGFKPRKGAKDNPIPYSNVQKIINNREARAVEAVAKSLGVELKLDGKKKFDEAITEAISGKLTSYRDLEGRAENFDRAEEIMTTDPDRYIRILATVEPDKYGKFLSVLEGGKKTKEDTTDPDEEILSQMPEMDVKFKLADGSEAETYSPQALQQMFVTAVKLGMSKGKQEAEGVVKPIRDARDQEAQDREKEALTQKEMAAALKWRGMDNEENFNAVLEALREDSKQATRNGQVVKKFLKYKNIRDAYIDVVPQRIEDAANAKEQEIRKKVLEDSKKTPTGTSMGSGTVSKKTESSGDPITDAIERAMAKAGL